MQVQGLKEIVMIYDLNKQGLSLASKVYITDALRPRRGAAFRSVATMLWHSGMELSADNTSPIRSPVGAVACVDAYNLYAVRRQYGCGRKANVAEPDDRDSFERLIRHYLSSSLILKKFKMTLRIR